MTRMSYRSSYLPLALQALAVSPRRVTMITLRVSCHYYDWKYLYDDAHNESYIFVRWPSVHVSVETFPSLRQAAARSNLISQLTLAMTRTIHAKK